MTSRANDEPSIIGESEIGRLTWIGLILAAIGWALLLGEATIADIVTVKAARPITPTFHADLLDVAKCLIGSGFALAIVGALQTGFGVLSRFFDAVLTRSGQRNAGASQPEPTIVPRESRTADRAPREPRVSERRPYRTLPDGSVEVETILGTRRFDTMAQAREFI